ncbi:MAG TPA: hypothetical protein PK295_01970 [Candidatus Magasanikbacteria bacterium]|nr:hypothetical protein [Candidatus Magasanikbacteria bacterium]
MANGRVVAIYISPVGESRTLVPEAHAYEGVGLKGDNSAVKVVTFVDYLLLRKKGIEYANSGANIVTEDIDLTSLVGEYFSIDDAKFKGLELDPDGRLVAEVYSTGWIRTRDEVVPPYKGPLLSPRCMC